jgi:hypothetical protein
MIPPRPPQTPAFFATGAALVNSLRMLTPSLTRAAADRLPYSRRREVRRSVRLACHARRMDDWRLVGDRVLDLSPEGMLLLSDERVEEGATLVVSFQATELPIWFDTCATVARIVQGRRPSDTGRALGVHFDTLPAVQRLILRGHLRALPQTTAQRDLPFDVARAHIDYAGEVQRILAA